MRAALGQEEQRRGDELGELIGILRVCVLGEVNTGERGAGEGPTAVLQRGGRCAGGVRGRTTCLECTAAEGMITRSASTSSVTSPMSTEACTS